MMCWLGVWVTLWASGCSGDRTSAAAGGRNPNVRNLVIVLIDTLRPDHLGCYGYIRDTSPNLDQLAAESVVFDAGYSVSPWTRSSVVSLFTSLHPATHSCQDEEDVVADELVMLAEVLRDKGLRTGGVSSNISVSADFNMTQGFEHFQYVDRVVWSVLHPERDPGYVPIEGMMADTYAWLDQVAQQPFFLYFHCADPHYQYMPPTEHQLWGDATPYDLYDGEVHYVDQFVGELIEKLRALKVLDETLLIITADHGEELGDHGFMGHGHTLYNELLQVPLIVRHPAFAARRRTEIVRLIDVLPTIVELWNCQSDGLRMQGRSLVPLLRGEADPSPEAHFIFAEVLYPKKMEGLSLQRDGWKFIWTYQDMRGKKDAQEFYAVTYDGREKLNYLVVHPNEAAAYRTAVVKMREEYAADKIEAVKKTLDPKTREALRALGYVE